MKSFATLPHEEQLAILLEVARIAGTRYGLGPGTSVQMLNLSENATYKVQAHDGRQWALRIHRDGYHSRAAIASELAWLIDLRRTGVVATPVPVPGIDGELIQDIDHPRLPRPRHAVLTDWEWGVEPGMDQDLSSPFEVLGEVTARMHVHARQWRRPPWFTRLTWDFETALGVDRPHWGRWRDGIGMDAAATKLFARTVDLIGKRLLVYGKGAQRFGLIHCDLRLANLLIDGRNIKAIDFDDCGFGWYMYDAAASISFYEHQRQVPELIESWKKGYRKVLDLPKADEDEIATFIMLRRILLVAWVASHIEAAFPRSLGAEFTVGTVPLCEDYLRRYG